MRTPLRDDITRRERTEGIASKNRVALFRCICFLDSREATEMRNWLEMNPSTLVLARGELTSLRLEGRACRISCVAGRLWVTASGRREDSVLAPGEELILRGRGRVVVEALRTATVRLERHAAARGAARATIPLGRLPAGLFQ
jgi:hypothetical protein